VIRGHDLSTGELKAELDGHSDLVLSMAVHGNTLFSGSGDTTIQVQYDPDIPSIYL
jgi:WD40 repeat protein